MTDTLNRSTSIDIADRCIPEVCKSIICILDSEVILTRGAMSADSIRAAMAFVYYLASEENVAK